MMEISITYYNYIHYSDSVIYAQINKLQATSQTSLVIIQHSARVTLVCTKDQSINAHTGADWTTNSFARLQTCTYALQ